MVPPIWLLCSSRVSREGRDASAGGNLPLIMLLLRSLERSTSRQQQRGLRTTGVDQAQPSKVVDVLLTMGKCSSCRVSRQACRSFARCKNSPPVHCTTEVHNNNIRGEQAATAAAQEDCSVMPASPYLPLSSHANSHCVQLFHLREACWYGSSQQVAV
jgi:hypothetical protein